jgi:hypothetical protein
MYQAMDLGDPYMARNFLVAESFLSRTLLHEVRT